MSNKTKKKAKTKIKKRRRTDTYKAHRGCKFNDSQAQEIGEGLEVVRQFYGGEVTPHQILGFAEKKSSRLHKYFEWDDKVAASKYRIKQASYMIRMVYIEVKTSSGPRVSRAFISIKSHQDSTRKYTSISEVMSDEDYYQTYLEDVVKQLVSIRNKHKSLRELKSVFNAIDRLRI